MINKILDGKIVSEAIYADLAREIKKLKTKERPKLAVILIGKNPASEVYVRQKLLACEKLGFEAEVHRFGSHSAVTEEDIIDLINELNVDPLISGILVQLPLPKELNKQQIIEAIKPEKDVDGLHPHNLGKIALGEDFESIIPCTALGVIKLLEFYGIPLEGQNIAVIGAGMVAGRPIALTLINRKATVSVLNSKTKDLSEYTKNADIVVAAAGFPGLVSAKQVKKGVVLVDVGINRLESGKITGDIDFEDCLEKAAWISPVPGGVGKMTVACLMLNLWQCFLKNSDKS